MDTELTYQRLENGLEEYGLIMDKRLMIIVLEQLTMSLERKFKRNLKKNYTTWKQFINTDFFDMINSMAYEWIDKEDIEQYKFVEDLVYWLHRIEYYVKLEENPNLRLKDFKSDYDFGVPQPF